MTLPTAGSSGGDEEEELVAEHEVEHDYAVRFYRPVGITLGVLTCLLALPITALGVVLNVIARCAAYERAVHPEEEDSEMILLCGCANDHDPQCNGTKCCDGSDACQRVMAQCSKDCCTSFIKWLRPFSVALVKLPAVLFTYWAWKTEC